MGKARRKEKDVTSDDKVYLQEDFLQCLAVEMELGELVNLPNGVLLNEWIASHTVNFFEHINLIYGTISEFCTMSGCSEMIGPNNKVYFWTDERGKRSSKVPAPQYIDYVMTYMQKTLNDESIFPTKADKDFPTNFEVYARKIYRLLFHVLAHIYHMHFNEIVILDLHKHLNCIFAHLILFNQQFNLIESKELETLNDLSIALKLLVPDNQIASTQQIETMQISTTPEPSLQASNSLEQYLDSANSKELIELNHHLDLQTSSNCFNQNQENSQQQRKKHSRQHSYTANQTISSPTNYIKRFISSLSPNNTSSSNQSCAINEENSNNPQSNLLTSQSKSPSSIRNEFEHNELCDQENHHHDLNKKNKTVLINFLNNKRTDLDKMQTDNFSSSISNSTGKTHKYQHSTPIFFSSSFFTNRTKLNDNNQQATERTADTNDVQFNNEKLNDKIIKENTKLLNQTNEEKEPIYCSKRTTTSSSSASAIYLQSSSHFSNNNLISNENENENEDYSLLDDQTTAMSCNQSQYHSNLDQMDTSSTFDRTDEEDLDADNDQTNIKRRTFGSLEIDENNEFDQSSDNNHRSSSSSSNNRQLLNLSNF